MQFNKEYVDKFDRTLCDVPCSGLGVAGKKADIYLDASMDKCIELSKIQYDILVNASKYTKRRIVYSTCTTLREENYNVVTDASGRAFAGLSMGGMQTINIGMCECWRRYNA